MRNIDIIYVIINNQILIKLTTVELILNIFRENNNLKYARIDQPFRTASLGR